MYSSLRAASFCCFAVILFAASAPQPQQTYDIVIQGGRVMDPESGLDAVRNVGIIGGAIRAISAEPLQGRTTIEARNLVVAPGFIDLHEHAQAPPSYKFQAHDGVTTSLELELGTADVDQFYREREGKALINFGVSAGHEPIRAQVLGAKPQELGAKPSDPASFEAAAHRAATEAELPQIRQRVDQELAKGALAVGLGINYSPGATHPEILDMFRVAARRGALVDVHIRYAGLQEPETGLAALDEVISDAAATGAALNVVHVSSVGLAQTPILMEVIAGARQRGVDVSTECYPYTAASTNLESAIFDPGWQQRLGISYGDLQWAATGERLTEQTFSKYRKQGGMVVIHAIPEAAATACVSDPAVIVASDGVPITGPKIHPRGQGTFARVLRHYVREQHALTLMDALRKMTLMPARRLEAHVPMMRNKGRIREGADADITIFDPATVIDKATYDAPLQYSAGIQYVLVNGVPVIKDGQFVEGIFPGRAIRAPVAQ